MVLSDREIKDLMHAKELIITGINPRDLYIGPSSMDLHLDNKAKILVNDIPDGVAIDTKNKESVDSMFRIHNDWSKLIIYPGEFYILSTKERMVFPKNVAGFVHGRSSLARLGINIHAAGFVDPGFNGTITLEVTNFTNVPIILYDNMRICKMVFIRTGESVETGYSEKQDAKYNGQEGPTLSKIYEDKKY